MYLNNVIVIGRMFQEHLLNLLKVFQPFLDGHLKSVQGTANFSEGSMVPWA
jgi:hypothetical protein